MLVKTVMSSAKGQLTLPVAMLRALGLKGPTEFLAVQDGDRILLTPAASVGRPLLDDLRGFEALAAPAFADVWDNDEDEVWDHA